MKNGNVRDSLTRQLCRRIRITFATFIFLGMDQALIFSVSLDIWISDQNRLIESEIDLTADQSYASEQLQNLEYLTETII